MAQPVTAEARPSRLPPVVHLLVVGALFLAFVSGALVWYGQTVNAGLDEPSFNLRPWLVLHGCLNPFLCLLFGYLLCHHIRYGWELRANWMTGAMMEVAFALLILSGVMLYYAPEAWRSVVSPLHHFTGLFLPIALIAHWVASRVWLKKISK